jgi:hypothetical protein
MTHGIPYANRLRLYHHFLKSGINPALQPSARNLRIPHPFWNSIPGWFDFYQLYTKIVESALENSVLVEIGVYEGKSAIFMANLIQHSKKDLKFFAIDPWEPMTDGNTSYDVTKEKFLSNVEACGVGDFVEALKGTSVEAANKFRDATVYFVFIDGEHSYSAVKADIAAWLPKMTPNGVLAGHDYSDFWPGVKQAVDEVLPTREIQGDSWIWRVQ